MPSCKKVVCNMSENRVKPPLEEHLLAQLSEIGRKQHQLEQEKMAIERMLVEVRRQNISLRDVSRKNSTNRIIIENRIISLLNLFSRPVSTHDLFKDVQIIDPSLKNVTFRSHLQRLKRRGAIDQPKKGYWITR